MIHNSLKKKQEMVGIALLHGIHQIEVKQKFVRENKNVIVNEISVKFIDFLTKFVLKSSITEGRKKNVNNKKVKSTQTPTCSRNFSSFFLTSCSRFCSAAYNLLSKMCFISIHFSVSRMSAVIFTSASLFMF